jgi:hypothetical protein
MSGTLNDLPDPVLANQAGADLGDRVALHRAEGGGMAGVSDRWLEGGPRVPGYVADAPAESLQTPDAPTRPSLLVTRRCPRCRGVRCWGARGERE